jgi:cysteine-rich repeat protein
MKLSPFSATFTEARDAIIAAALANDPVDAQVMAEAFARRGVGSCAISPERTSMDLIGVVESFEVAPKAEVADITITPPDTCDADPFLDAGETGTLSVVVRNGGMEPLVGAQLTVATELAGVTFPAGATAAVPDVPALGSHTVELEVALDGTITELTVLGIDATVTSTDTCEASTASSLETLINADDVAEASATERAESSIEVWSKTGAHADDIWSRVELSATEHVWNGINYSLSSSDTALESPDLTVGTDPLVVSFDHAYSFEFGFDGTMVFWDGGVIEITEDGGQSWTDISTYADPGYSGVMTSGWGNVLGGRMGYAAKSDAFPAMHPVSLDLGTAFANKTVRLRFRIGTDINTGAPGWFIDNIAFQGITNTPFASLVADDGECGAPSACGNGVLDQWEQCDNGENNSDSAPDACRTNCKRAECGDGVLDQGEMCDEGDDNSDAESDACRKNCLPHRCGDGVADDDEECDDGIFNTNGPDACRSNCAAPRCGDAVRDFGEQCDDGNGINGDLCTNECVNGPLSIEDGFFDDGDAEAASPRPPAKVYAEGCGCAVPGSGSGRGRGAQAMLLALGLALSSRRRKGGV